MTKTQEWKLDMPLYDAASKASRFRSFSFTRLKFLQQKILMQDNTLRVHEQLLRDAWEQIDQLHAEIAMMQENAMAIKNRDRDTTIDDSIMIEELFN